MEKKLTHRIAALSTAAVFAFSNFTSVISTATYAAELEDPEDATTMQVLGGSNPEEGNNEGNNTPTEINNLNDNTTLEQTPEEENLTLGTQETPEENNITQTPQATESYKVSFDTGTVLPDSKKLVDQTVLAGDSVAEPTNASGETLSQILTYCSTSFEDDCYNEYKFEGFYLEPTFDTLYNNNPVTRDMTLYAKWTDLYEGYERIKEVNITIMKPKAGTEVVIDDPENLPWDSQHPQLEASVPADAKYELYVFDNDIAYNYAYWLKGHDWEDYEPYAGVLEGGKSYWAEIWLKIKEGELAIFDYDLVLKVNGEVVPTELTDYDVDDVALMLEVAIDEEEEESPVTAPDSGAFTATSSATSATSGIAVATLVGLAYIFFKKKSTRR